MRTLSVFSVSLLAAGSVACAGSKMTVKSDFDNQVNFQGYKTFVVASEAGQINMIATDGYDIGYIGGEVAPDLKQQAAELIQERLVAKGLVPAGSAEEADVVVTYLINIGAKPEVLAPDYRMNNFSGKAELGATPIAKGTLVIDVLDPKLDQSKRSFLVWRGWASTDLDPEEMKQNPRGTKMKEAIEKILSRYPN
jgi:hypothetical protein